MTGVNDSAIPCAEVTPETSLNSVVIVGMGYVGDNDSLANEILCSYRLCEFSDIERNLLWQLIHSSYSSVPVLQQKCVDDE